MNKKIKFILIGFLIALIPVVIFGKREIAIKYQKQAIDLCPQWVDNPDFEAGMKKIDLAIKLAPGNLYLYNTKAQFLERQAKYREANKVWESTLRFKKDFAEGHLAIALNFERLGLKDSAKIEYMNTLQALDSRILKRQNDSERLFSAKLLKAYVLKQAEQIEQSKKEFKELKAVYPGKIEIIKSIEDSGFDFMD